jgi:hypothetical protein
MGPDTGALLTQIRNDCWPVRYYSHARTQAMRLRREQAIKRLGLTVRYAFSASDDFEALLITLVDGLNTKETKPF